MTRRGRIRAAVCAAVLAVAAGTAGCGTPQRAGTSITVAAAGALRPAFTRIAEAFHTANPDVTVAFDFASSPELAVQLVNGAPADVFASADEKNMDKLGDQATGPTIFATNTLVIVTAPGNPKGIASIADLNKAGVTTVVCQSAQPCGNATDAVEKNTGVTVKAASEEQSVTAVLTKVTSGQADAGLVYVTDAESAGDKVATVTDPAFAEVVNKYPIATVSGAANEALGKEFVELVTGAAGQKILRDAGFGKP